MKMAYTDNGETLVIILDKKEGKNLCTILQQGMTVAKKNSAEKNAVADRHLSNAMEVLRDRYRKIQAGFRRGFQLWLLDELEKRK